MDLNAPTARISVDDIATWEAKGGIVPQGAIVAVRRAVTAGSYPSDQFPVSADATQFLMDARHTRGFIIETPASLDSDRTLSRQIALHGNYVVDESTPLAALPETGSLVIVAPEKDRKATESPVRVLAMVPATVHGKEIRKTTKILYDNSEYIHRSTPAAVIETFATIALRS